MTENEYLKLCLRELSLICAGEKLKTATPSAKAIERKRRLLREIRQESLELEKAYFVENMNYKTIKASPRAIKASEERRALIRQILNNCSELDAVLAIKGNQGKANTSLTFTIF